MVTGARYLGVDIPSGLSWNFHIDTITAKANGTLGFMKGNIKTKKNKIKVREDAFNTLVRPPLEYAVPLLDPHTKEKIFQLENVQHRAVHGPPVIMITDQVSQPCCRV